MSPVVYLFSSYLVSAFLAGLVVLTIGIAVLAMVNAGYVHGLTTTETLGFDRFMAMLLTFYLFRLAAPIAALVFTGILCFRFHWHVPHQYRYLGVAWLTSVSVYGLFTQFLSSMTSFPEDLRPEAPVEKKNTNE